MNRLLTIALVVCSVVSKAQISNAGFENWTFSTADDWLFCAYGPIASYCNVKDSNAHEGKYAIKMRIRPPVQYPSPFSKTTAWIFTAGYSPPPLPITLGAGPMVRFRPLAVKPNKLNGWIIFNGNGIDTAEIRISTKGGLIIVGTGTTLITATTLTYTPFTVNIVYTSTITPDSFSISFGLRSIVHDSSYFILDDLSFDQTVGIQEDRDMKFKLFPNPVQDLLMLESETPSELTIFDLSGRPIFNTMLTAGRSEINTAQFAPGVYVIYAKASKGGRYGRFVKME